MKRGTATATPRLRFPEFRAAGEWKMAPLSRIADRIATKNRDGRVSRVLTNSAEFGVLDQRDYFDKDIATAGKVDSYCIVGKGDYVYNPRTSAIAPVGPISRNNLGEGVMSPLYTVFRFSDVQTDFYEHYFRSNGWHSYLRSAASTGARHDRMSITTDAFMRMPLPVPTPEEQQKIADCLTSLDEMIASQGRKVETLKAHKRGLMQQLFPREGECRPRLRFPEFRKAPAWITRPLGELMVIGSSRRVHESDWTTAGVPFYRAREIVAMGKGEPISPLFISEALYREFAGYTGEIEEGQLLVTGVGSIGIPYLVKFGDRFYFKDGNIIWLKNNQADLAGNFLLRLFESGYVQGQITTMAGIGTVGTYTIDSAKRTIAVFPVDKREQQRIADCLSSLDTQITAESNQLASLKSHKQGLMQQLFPTPEAASA